MKQLLSSLLLFLVVIANAEKPVGWWKFDTISTHSTTPESINQSADTLFGHNKLIPGIRNMALKTDESSTYFIVPASDKLRFNTSFSIEVWLAIQTYPWNWCPIIEQKDSSAGFFFGIDYQGRIGFKIKTTNGWYECTTRPAIAGLDETVNFAGEAGKRKKAHFPENACPDPLLPLLKWNHLVARYDAGTQQITLLLNGKIEAQTIISGRFEQATNTSFSLFRSPSKLPLLFVARPKANEPVHTAIDGLVDELRLYDYALTDQVINDRIKNEKPEKQEAFSYRRMPTGQDKPGKFGAFYTLFNYDEDWDRNRRFSGHQDILVRFDKNPCTFVAWNGTIYPVMYNETGDAGQMFEAYESWNENGCNEAMMDKTNRYSTWRIIENTAARVVLHWRHTLVSFNNKFFNFDPVSNTSDWVDDYYYIYPDFVIARKTILHSSKPVSNHSYSQDNSVIQPEFMPRDIYENNPISFAGLNGTVIKPQMGKKNNSKADDSSNIPTQIQLHNFKSDYKPFMIAPPNEKLMGVWTNDEPWPWFLPCWHHWPVAQIRSDGATTFVNNGRPKSSCLTNGWGYGNINRSAVALTTNSLTRYSMIGMTNQSIEELVPLARSWHNAPEMKIITEGFYMPEYKTEERTYHITGTGEKCEKLKIKVNASTQRPSANLSIVIHNCDINLSNLKINNKKRVDGKDFSIGRLINPDSDALIIWINYYSEEPYNIELY